MADRRIPPAPQPGDDEASPIARALDYDVVLLAIGAMAVAAGEPSLASAVHLLLVCAALIAAGVGAACLTAAAGALWRAALGRREVRHG